LGVTSILQSSTATGLMVTAFAAGGARAADAAPCRDATPMWLRWLTTAGVPDLKPARDHVFEHFYFAIQAAIEGLGVAMGPLALVSDELREGRLLAPIKEPAVRLGLGAAGNRHLSPLGDRPHCVSLQFLR
jgi:DNA-binding transcriptional LysR family regulator